ncbi:hypothetical protein SUGI_0656850 [Cryptomeria japonica]|nr:hypothetical protein SUGI_0656850 [Cryptomeria japonica]
MAWIRLDVFPSKHQFLNANFGKNVLRSLKSSSNKSSSDGDGNGRSGNEEAKLLFCTVQSQLCLWISIHLTLSFRLCIVNAGREEWQCHPAFRIPLCAVNISSVELARMFKWAPTLQRLQTLDKVEGFVGVLEENGFKPLILTLSLEQRPILAVTFSLNLYQSQDLFLKSILKNRSILIQRGEYVKTLHCILGGLWLSQTGAYQNFGLKAEHSALHLFHDCTTVSHSENRYRKRENLLKSYKDVLILLATSPMATLEAKIRNFQLCGLSYEETMELFRLSPNVFGLTEANIRAKMDFVVKNMELPPNFVIKYRTILYINLDKVIKPRFFVWKKMASMNGLENFEIKSLCTMLNMREAGFITKILNGHPQAATLFAIYEKRLADASSSSAGTMILRRCSF